MNTEEKYQIRWLPWIFVFSAIILVFQVNSLIEAWILLLFLLVQFVIYLLTRLKLFYLGRFYVSLFLQSLIFNGISIAKMLNDGNFSRFTRDMNFIPEYAVKTLFFFCTFSVVLAILNFVYLCIPRRTIIDPKYLFMDSKLSFGCVSMAYVILSLPTIIFTFQFNSLIGNEQIWKYMSVISYPIVTMMFVLFSVRAKKFGFVSSSLFLLFIITTLDGGKEGILRVFYILFSLYLINEWSPKKKFILIGTIIFPIAAIGGFVLGTIMRLFRQNNTAAEIDLVELENIFYRVGSLDNIYPAFVSKIGRYSETFSLGNMFKSLANLSLPGSIFDDVFPTTLQYGETVLDKLGAIKYYTSYEVTLPGHVYIMSENMLHFIFNSVITILVFSLLALISCKLLGKMITTLIFMYSTSYMIRALSVDDIIYFLVQSIVSAIIFLLIVRFFNKIRATKSLYFQ